MSERLSRGLRKYIRRQKAFGNESAVEAVVRPRLEKQRSIVEEERARKLAEEKEQDGVRLEYLRQFLAQDLGTPQEVAEKTVEKFWLDLKMGFRDWQGHQNILNVYLDDLCDVDPQLYEYLHGQVVDEEGTTKAKLIAIRDRVIPPHQLSQYRSPQR